MGQTKDIKMLTIWYQFINALLSNDSYNVIYFLATIRYSSCTYFNQIYYQLIASSLKVNFTTKPVKTEFI